jgi:hypothetical protein
VFLKEAFSGCLFKAEGVRHVTYSKWFLLVAFIQGFQTKTIVARALLRQEMTMRLGICSFFVVYNFI